MPKTYLLNQPVAEDAEQKDLGQGIDQIPDDGQPVHVESVDLGRLVGQQRQLDGRGQHVQQQGRTVRVADGRDQPGVGKSNKKKTVIETKTALKLVSWQDPYRSIQFELLMAENTT